ncbi:hypothetical protein EDD18DRAFT_1113845 [Armillaria luteobubalina]|uniref:Uncharacterized protein n=1 Tax=Armillaria luteobubalina TaxID=153913 RepID=A0AA39P971_9AGAR|nr:hypothetical protein EDD18DRAFT_1113845 [Armillaria luteobubalina]
MATGTYLATVIPELTNSQIKDIVAYLDIGLNDAILCALLYAPNLYGDWAPCIITFTTLAWKSVSETYSLSNSPTPVKIIVDVCAILSTLLAAATLAWNLIWRCWIVWGRSWRVVLVPIACTTLAAASRGIVAYDHNVGPLASPQTFIIEKAVNWALLTPSFVMATLLWCTILIIYRILRVGGVAGRTHVYQRLIEILVESALLYSVVIVLMLVFIARNEVIAYYMVELVNAMRGIVPTMLVGRVAAGHARPDDSWSDSTPGSPIQFGNHSASQDNTQMGVGSGRGTSSTEGPDLEQGLEDITEVRVEGAAPIGSTQDYHHVVGTSCSVDHNVVMK